VVRELREHGYEVAATDLAAAGSKSVRASSASPALALQDEAPHAHPRLNRQAKTLRPTRLGLYRQGKKSNRNRDCNSSGFRWFATGAQRLSQGARFSTKTAAVPGSHRIDEANTGIFPAPEGVCWRTSLAATCDAHSSPPRQRIWLSALDFGWPREYQRGDRGALRECGITSARPDHISARGTVSEQAVEDARAQVAERGRV